MRHKNNRLITKQLFYFKKTVFRNYIKYLRKKTKTDPSSDLMDCELHNEVLEHIDFIITSIDIFVGFPPNLLKVVTKKNGHPKSSNLRKIVARH